MGSFDYSTQSWSIFPPQYRSITVGVHFRAFPRCSMLKKKMYRLSSAYINYVKKTYINSAPVPQQPFQHDTIAVITWSMVMVYSTPFGWKKISQLNTTRIKKNNELVMIYPLRRLLFRHHHSWSISKLNSSSGRCTAGSVLGFYRLKWADSIELNFLKEFVR